MAKRGRPKKKLTELPDGWKENVLNAGKQGYSDIEIRVGILDISNNLWGRLMEEEGEFWETITRARDYSQTWWLKHSRKELHSREFNNKLYEMNMQNRYGWNKKTEVEHSGKIEGALNELTNEQLDALINAGNSGTGKEDKS